MIISPFLTGQLSPAPSSLGLKRWADEAVLLVVFQYQSLVTLPPSCLLQFNPLRFCPSQWPSVSFEQYGSAFDASWAHIMIICFYFQLSFIWIPISTICSPIFLDSKYHSFPLTPLYIQNLEASILKFLLLISVDVPQKFSECNTAELVFSSAPELVRGECVSRSYWEAGCDYFFRERDSYNETAFKMDIHKSNSLNSVHAVLK